MPENFSQLNLTTDNLTIYGPREVYLGDTVKLHCVSGPSIPGTAGELNRVPSDSNLTAAEIHWYLREIELNAKTVKFSLKNPTTRIPYFFCFCYYCSS